LIKTLRGGGDDLDQTMIFQTSIKLKTALSDKVLPIINTPHTGKKCYWVRVLMRRTCVIFKDAS